MRRAFVSHSTADDSFVAEMESFLRAAGFDDVFNDVLAIKPDEQFWTRIEQGINDCDAFVVVITAAATNSEWVKREVALARRLGKRVIPVWREDCPLPPEFSDRDVIDFRPRTHKKRRFDIGRIVKYAPAELIGREGETKLLNDAWQKALRLEKGRPHVLTFVALGGEGKTSLVAKWAAELAGQDWRGCDAAFAWSFYSQGTREQLAASSDLFLKDALTFFGDEAMAGSAAGAFEKGRRLAQLVGERRTLLILDGLEPLQYASSSPTAGELKDQGLAVLLKRLAADSRGLCIVTTRYSLPDLRAFWQTTAPEVKLLRLSRDAGVHLLKTLGVRGTEQEFAALVENVKGHALTLTLLGGFLKRAFHGDIRQRDRVKFEKADEKMDGGHAFRTMAAYEQWLLRDGGDEGRREVAVLRLMGLFDRPADAGCLAALRREPITGVTEPLSGLADDDWEYCLSGLEAANLLTVNRDASDALDSLDAHPLLREYFARQLRAQQPDAWRAAHRRLYEHLCTTAQDKPQPTLEDLQPLYQAVAHGCLAGLHQLALEAVYRDRVLHGTGQNGYYTHRHLGAAFSDLATLGCFFEVSWNRPVDSLSEPAKAWVFYCGGTRLADVGRLTEAIEALCRGLAIWISLRDWSNAFGLAGQLVLAELALGKVTRALDDARQASTFARQAIKDQLQVEANVIVAHILAQAGAREEASDRFREAETHHAKCHAKHPLLHSGEGSLYCDFLLCEVEAAAWLHCCHHELPVVAASESLPSHLAPRHSQIQNSNHLATSLTQIESRARKALIWADDGCYSLCGVSSDHFTLGRAALYRALVVRADAITVPESQKQQSGEEQIKNPLLQTACHELSLAEAGFRSARDMDHLARTLLARAWLRFLTGARRGPDSAQTDLDEAWELAEFGPRRLHMADIHLYRARLFFREKQYPWESPAADLAAAEKLINDCGYHRRDEELADAKRAILGA